MEVDNKQFWRFENSATNGTEAHLYIYGDIMQYDYGWWNWPDDVIPNRFRKELDALENVSKIHVRINSGGGSVFGAYAIMNLLKSHKAQIITYNDGIAASAATLIAMAGDKVVSSLGSMWMIHLPATSVFGNTAELQKAIEILGAITESMLDIYHARTGIARDELLKMLNEDTWMTGAQAKERGFVDEVTDFKVVAYLGGDKETAFFNGLPVELAKVRNKEKFVAMLPSKQPAEVQEKPAPSNNSVSTQNNGFGQNPGQREETVMNLTDLKAKHPETYNAAVNEGIAQATSSEAIEAARAEGVTAERARIQAIDNMASPGMEAHTNKAKYETGITAEALAMELVMAQKEKGANYLAAVQADAAAAEEVPSAGAPQSDEAEAEALLAYLAKQNN